MIAIAGAITVIAPLLFSLLNYWFSRLNPTAAGVVAVCLTTKASAPGECAAPGASVTIAVPAGGSVAIRAAPGALAPDTSVDVPVDGQITIGPMTAPVGGGQQRVLVLTAIRTLADSRDGSTVSNAGNSSFTL